MNAVRGAMTVFLLTVLTLAFLGWRWSVRLPSPNLEGARVVLVLVALSSLVGLGLIWSAKPRKSP